MSNIPYPSDFQIDFQSAHEEERHRRALKPRTVSDVLADLDDLLADEPNLVKHPCHGLLVWLLDPARICDGGQLFEALT